MRYRYELLGDDEPEVHGVGSNIVVFNTDLDVWVAFVHDPPDRPSQTGCTVTGRDGGDITSWSPTAKPPFQLLQSALYSAAFHELENAFPSGRYAKEDRSSIRVEREFGRLHVDIVLVAARALQELLGEGLKPATEEELAELLVRLQRIGWCSRFGSFNIESRRLGEAYFRSISGGRRLSFDAAAQEWGIWELQDRFVDAGVKASDQLLQTLLGWPTNLLEGLLDDHLRRLPPPRVSSVYSTGCRRLPPPRLLSA
jgi:hypothetical protein